MSQHRELKDPLYEHFARVGHAAASPKRVELLDLLSQGPKTVEALAAGIATPVKNTSAHLRVLRQARLVETRRAGTHVHYRLADDSVIDFLRALRTLAHRRLAEVEQVASLYLTRRDRLEPVSLAELRRMLREGRVTVLDVRPPDEYEAGHIPGALSIPVAELERRLAEVPAGREVVAYCRGPYCVFSLEAVETLRGHGYAARRADEGLPEWRAEGWPVREGHRP
jgi:rhodanese-related sulfurtransferase